MPKYRNCPNCRWGGYYCYDEPHSCSHCGHLFAKSAWDELQKIESDCQANAERHQRFNYDMYADLLCNYFDKYESELKKIPRK